MDRVRSETLLGSLHKRGSTRTSLTWDQAIDMFLADAKSRLAEKTWTCYESHLRLLQDWANSSKIEFGRFTSADMRQYLTYRQATVSKNTARKDAVIAKAMLRMLRKEKAIASNPLAEYTIPKYTVPYVKIPSDEDVSNLLDSIARRWSPTTNPPIRNIHIKRRQFFERRNLAIIAGLVDTASRPGELLSVRLSDWYPDRGWLDVRETKTGTPLGKPFSQEWIEMVKAWLKVRPVCESDLLFISEYGGPITVDVLGHIVSDQIKWAGLPHFTMYSLRHYSLTKLSRANLHDTQSIAGHSSLKTTQRYLHTNEENMAATHAEAAPLSRILNHKRTARRKLI